MKKIVKELEEIVRSRRFLIISAIVAGLFSPIVVLDTIRAETEEILEYDVDYPFLSMTTLNSEMKSSDYFPVENRTLSVGDKMRWHVVIHNGMDKAQYLNVRVKLLNSTQTIPDDASNQPSPEPTMFEMTELVAKDSHWTIPLEWAISKVNSDNNGIAIEEISINGEFVTIANGTIEKGHNFRMILELWRYDGESRNFEYAWSGESKNMRSVWNQIWFSVRS